MKVKLTKEEKKIEDTLARGEWKSRPKKQVHKLEALAKEWVATQKKDARVNIRMAPEDLTKLRQVANQEGLPYQTFMSSILHKYVTGQLVEKKLLQELERMVIKR